MRRLKLKLAGRSYYGATIMVPLNTNQIVASDSSRASIVPYLVPEDAWCVLSALLPAGQPGKPRVDDRRIVSGIVFVLQTRCRWQDAPEAYGPYMTLYNRYNRWTRRGVWRRIRLKVLASETECSILLNILDTLVRRGSNGGFGSSD
ncbi:transposase [Methylorubrum populi]|nr:transposase [Methylorubrum populi]